MKSYKLFATAVLMSFCAVLPAQAQKTAGQDQQYEYVFNPHWFIQGQFGGQYTLGELKFSDLTSLNAQVGAGYEFNPWLAARLSFNFWQGKEGFKKDKDNTYKWDWKYVAPTIDAMFDLSNAIGGFNPERKISLGAIVGLGMNVVFSKDDADKTIDEIVAGYPAGIAPGFYKNATGPFAVGRLGAYIDWHITDNLALGLELQSNTTLFNDKYNSKAANDGNWDWYFNGLVGLKYCFGGDGGKTYEKRAKEKLVPVSEAANYAPDCDPVEKVVEKVVEKPIEVTVPSIYEEIYYDINKDQISANEKYKLRRIVDFMKKYPDTKIEISSHADKATGTSDYNQKISERRAANVAKALVENGISESRISTSAHGSSQNMYSGDEMKLNRVSICIAK